MKITVTISATKFALATAAAAAKGISLDAAIISHAAGTCIQQPAMPAQLPHQPELPLELPPAPEPPQPAAAPSAGMFDIA